MKMLRAEWKKVFSNRILLTIMIGIPLVPLIYAGIILSAYWDPFGKAEDLPVAVVNQDVPANFEDKTLDIGEELVNNLKENESLNWQFVTEDEAKTGFDNGDYYMVITIPEDFSQHATTLLDDQPEKMDLTYTVNPGRNFFSVTVSEKAMEKINKDISDTVNQEYTRAIFSQIGEIGTGFAAAADGAAEIDDGVITLGEGNEEITDNLNILVSGTLEFKEGTEALESGVNELSDGADALNAGASELNQGIVQYTDGVSQLKDKMAPLANFSSDGIGADDDFNELLNGSYHLNQGLVSLNEQLPSQTEIDQLSQGLAETQAAVNQLNEMIAQSEGPPALKAQVAALNEAVNQVQPQAIGALEGYTNVNHALSGEGGLIEGSSKISGGINMAADKKDELTAAVSGLTEGIPQLVDAVNQLDANSANLRDGSAGLVSGTETMTDNLPTLTAGINQLNSGATELNQGAGQLEDGSTQLGEGIDTLHAGTTELSDELSEGAEAVNGIKASDDNFAALASPIDLTEKETSEVPNYGHALAPMFISLGLYIGALAFSLVFPMSETSIRPTSSLAWWFSKFSLGFVPAVAGALVLNMVVVYGMGLEVASMWQFNLITILGSLAYMFLMLFFVVPLGNPGRFIAMILLVLQLASSGGMFPLVLQNNFFNAISPYMPMTYVIYGLREAMSGSLGSGVFNMSVIVLIACIIGFNLLLLLYYYVQKKRAVDPVVAEAQ